MDFAELFAFCDLHATRWRARDNVVGLDWTPSMMLNDLLFPRYFDRQGFPIPGEQDGEHGVIMPTLIWARLHSDREYAIVASDDLPDGSRLSTVWLGLDHAFGGRPLIFETMRFSGEWKEFTSPFVRAGQAYHESMLFPDPETGEHTDQLRYHTEEQALAAHHEIVRRIVLKEGH